MKNIYLHIGLHKTGSTYIQKQFSEHRSFLNANGVCYPEIGAEFLYGHHNFAWSFIPNKKDIDGSIFSTSEFVAHLEAMPAEKIIISSEDFDFFKTKQIVELSELLKQFNVQIVLYARCPSSMFYSLWQERIKHGDTIPIQRFYDDTVHDPRQLDYCQISETWSDIFGQEAVSIVVYDHLIESGKNVAAFFLESLVGLTLNLDFLEADSTIVNPSSSMAVAESIRLLNCLNERLENIDRIGNKFISFLTQSAEGQQVLRALGSIDDESLEVLSLKRLNRVFLKKEEDFLKQGYKVLNSYSARKMFKSEGIESLAVFPEQSSCLAEAFDIKKVYSTLTSDTKSF